MRDQQRLQIYQLAQEWAEIKAKNKEGDVKWPEV